MAQEVTPDTLKLIHCSGLFSVVFLIFNRVIGTGSVRRIRRPFISFKSTRIYATPSVILRSSGSVGVALLMWLLGALIAAAGTTVYIELGTVCPDILIVECNSHLRIYAGAAT
jgi:hypothetical protein